MERRPHGATPTWSAGVLAGLRRTAGPSRSLLPTTPPHGATAPWSAGVLAGLRRTAGPSGSLLPTAPAPWSAGVLAGLRRTAGPSGSLLPTAPPHGAPASSPACAAPSVPQAVSCRQRRRTFSRVSGTGTRGSAGFASRISPFGGMVWPMFRAHSTTGRSVPEKRRSDLAGNAVAAPEPRIPTGPSVKHRTFSIGEARARA